MSKRIITELPVKLEDCPFCGRDAQVVFEDRAGKPSRVHVECKWCGGRTGNWNTNILREYGLICAVEYWNRREKVPKTIDVYSE